MSRRLPGAIKVDVDENDDDRSEWIDAKNTRRSVPASERKFSGSAQMPSQEDFTPQAKRSSENLFHRTSRNTTSSEALFMSPTSRLLYDRTSQQESNQDAGLLESL
jgi:hypothetical protein